ncbi:MAG: isochorismatase family protein [Sporomusaceae bacterium]|nr:isochorismatase family protein [Sporomusaceae bacterium]
MRIEAADSLVLIIDMQEKLLPHIDRGEEITAKASLLLAGTAALGLPRLAARQYPKGLGDTVAAISSYFDTYWDKTSFSCCGSEPLLAQLQQSGKNKIILAGVESHVCVLQTAIDLKAAGFLPVIAADATGSRRDGDYRIALRRLEQEGALLTTVESILFELCRQAGSEAFKTISQLVK